jgi:UDP-N-acetylmuramoyl-tripeptide--D-alanyl-D-alanine ligase
MNVLWTSVDAALATGGRATRDFSATGVSIDTRSLQPGDLFVALTNARDGHDFVAQALAKGASAAMVARVPEGVAADAPLLIVRDVLGALTALGQAGRARAAARVVAVTGSVGKTSTKDMLRVILAGQGSVHAAEASYNNHWGVPLTLARLPKDSDFAVIEIGMNHPGEIAPLAQLARPHVALITTVGPAHLEAFGSVDGIAEEKAAIMTGLEPGGMAILPEDLPTTPVLLACAQRLHCRYETFGAAAGSVWRLKQVSTAEGATVIQARHADQDFLFKVMSPGRHFATNGLGALAAASALGLDPAIAATDLARWAPPSGRGTRERVVLDAIDGLGFDLIDDAFNSNPASLAASLDMLMGLTPEDGCGRVGKGRRIAILGDMLELGATELDLHRAIAQHPALGAITTIHCVGPRMRSLWDILPRAQRGEWAPAASDLLPRLRGLVDAGDVVLVKGSKGIKVSLVVDAFRKLGHSIAPHQQGVE